jgi:succinate-semialdehyde dehydrogenase/glutarate-semialdehyde dehydrogenase
MQTRNLINGEWVGARSGRQADIVDPATDEVIAQVPVAGRDETRTAIEAAQAAFEGWSQMPPNDRGRLLRSLADLMLSKREDLAHLMTREQGKPLAESRGEIAYAASFIDWAAEEGKRVYGDLVPASFPNKRILVLRQPVGVTACITPWNFPSAMITRKLGPALAAGCTMVVKPAMQTPLSALAIGELAVEAGFPPGVINIVTGDSHAIGDELFENRAVRKVSFTGSTEVGKILMKKAAHHVTRLSLELGGHAPFLVFDDADLDVAVAAAMATKFRNMGQTCICANRFFVQDGVYDAFLQRLADAVGRMTIGRGTEDGVQVGPLIDDAAVAKVVEHVDDARARGAAIVTGGRIAEMPSGLSRRFYQPTLIDGFTDDMLVSREETFGPVAPLRRFSHEEEAVAMANDSPYGLAAYFFTRDASRLMRVAERLDYGVIGANDGLPSTAQAPFGGMKESGFGREGGRYVMHEYLETKYVSWGLS